MTDERSMEEILYQRIILELTRADDGIAALMAAEVSKLSKQKGEKDGCCCSPRGRHRREPMVEFRLAHGGSHLFMARTRRTPTSAKLTRLPSSGRG